VRLPAPFEDLYARHGEKLRFLVVGGWNTLFSVARFNVLYFLAGPSLRALAGTGGGLAQLIAANDYNVVFWAGWVLSVPQSTLTMKYLVFRSRGHLGRELGKAFLVYLPAQGVASAMMWLLVGLAGLHPTLAQLCTIAVATVISYLGHKFFTFRTPTEVLAEDANPPANGV
jgi:putative flippase GtrA